MKIVNGMIGGVSFLGKYDSQSRNDIQHDRFDKQFPRQVDALGNRYIDSQNFNVQCYDAFTNECVLRVVRGPCIHSLCHFKFYIISIILFEPDSPWSFSVNKKNIWYSENIK